MRLQQLLASLGAALALSGAARAEEQPRIAVVVVEPALGATGFRATVGGLTATDALQLMGAMQAQCDGRNHERGDHLAVLARGDVTLDTQTNVMNIATKPCLDRVVAFVFRQERQHVSRVPAPAASDPHQILFSTEPEDYRALLGE